jgi:hypothetical protein
LDGFQAGDDVAQALAERELREGQRQELIAARKRAPATIAPIARDASMEVASRQKLHELREHDLAFVHNPTSENYFPESVAANSSRVHASNVTKSRPCRILRHRIHSLTGQ